MSDAEERIISEGPGWQMVRRAADLSTFVRCADIATAQRVRDVLLRNLLPEGEVSDDATDRAEPLGWSCGGWKHTLTDEGHLLRWSAVLIADDKREIRDFGLVPGGVWAAVRALVSALAAERASHEATLGQLTAAQRKYIQAHENMLTTLDVSSRLVDAAERRLKTANELLSRALPILRMGTNGALHTHGVEVNRVTDDIAAHLRGEVPTRETRQPASRIEGKHAFRTDVPYIVHHPGEGAFVVSRELIVKLDGVREAYKYSYERYPKGGKVEFFALHITRKNGQRSYEFESRVERDWVYQRIVELIEQRPATEPVVEQAARDDEDDGLYHWLNDSGWGAHCGIGRPYNGASSTSSRPGIPPPEVDCPGCLVQAHGDVSSTGRTDTENNRHGTT